MRDVQRHVLIRRPVRVVYHARDAREHLHRHFLARQNLHQILDVGDGCIEHGEATIGIESGRVEQVQEVLRRHFERRRHHLTGPAAVVDAVSNRLSRTIDDDAGKVLLVLLQRLKWSRVEAFAVHD